LVYVIKDSTIASNPSAASSQHAARFGAKVDNRRVMQERIALISRLVMIAAASTGIPEEVTMCPSF
jgi:hypothetical protein